jgi:hypothetical protein
MGLQARRAKERAMRDGDEDVEVTVTWRTWVGLGLVAALALGLAFAAGVLWPMDGARVPPPRHVAPAREAPESLLYDERGAA